jgi:UDP-N-acetylmuramate dehydrogenase
MIELQENIPLKSLNTWRVGGAAEYYIEPESPERLSAFLSEHAGRFAQITWLGLGSNVLIPDAGLTGLVINTTNLDALRLLEPNLIYAQAGVTCAKLAKFCAKNQLSGGAFFAGIPGTVGGALAMNAGAFGGETWPLVEQVDVIRLTGEVTRKQASDFNYTYRHVRFLDSENPGNSGFLGAVFKFELVHTQEDGQEKVRTLLKKRNETQPIGTYNCGSVFRNPSGFHAARLIESCGLKGKKIGGAVVSLKHANFIINEDNATAEEIYRLIVEVKNTVFQETGVTLVPEVKFLGWQGSENP